MSETPKRSLNEAIRRAIHCGLADLHVSLPARVARVDLERNLVDAQPLLMDVVEQPDGSTQAVAFPVITNVPIQVANGGGFRMTFPVAVGDVVALVFSDRSIDQWLAKGGGPVDPVDPRNHALSDALVAIPTTNPSAPWTIRANAITIGKEGGPLIVLEAGAIRLDDGDAAVAREGDAVAASTDVTTVVPGVSITMAAWIAAVTAALAGAGPAVKVGLLPPANFGVVDQGAARVKA